MSLRTCSVVVVAVVFTFANVVHAKPLTIGLASAVTTMDPHAEDRLANNAVLSHIFEALVHVDARDRLIPGLAVSWQRVNDTTWQFKLRANVTFHDGAPFTADDVVFTLSRLLGDDGIAPSLHTLVEGMTVKKLDDFTVEIVTERPNPSVPSDLAAIAIVSRSARGKAVTIGTGPYRFKAFGPKAQVVITRNEDYWSAKSEWTEVTFKAIESDFARVRMLMAGDLDIVEAVQPAMFEYLKQDPKFTLSQARSNRLIYLQIDHDRARTPFVTTNDDEAMDNPLLERRIRLVISKAIDRDKIVKDVLKGAGVKAGQFAAKDAFGTSPRLPPVKFAPEEIDSLLRDSGASDGFKLTIHGPEGRYTNDREILRAVGAMLTDAGLETSVVTLPEEQYFKRATRGSPSGMPEFSVYLLGWSTRRGDVSSTLLSLMHTYDRSTGRGRFNRGRYSDEDVDFFLMEALVTLDEKAREKLLIEATEFAITDAAIIPLHFQVNTWALKKGLTYRGRMDAQTRAMDVYSN